MIDRELVERARGGDREAFAVLARAHSDRLYAIGQRILRDSGLAEDALQQALVQGWREVPNLRDPDRFEGWLTRLLIHACYAEARRRSRTAAHIRVLPLDIPSTRDDVLSVDDRDQLERGFRRLPADQRSVLVLHHYVGLEPAEISEALGIPPGTVRSRLHYAHRAMRAALEADSRPARASGGSLR